MPKKLIHLVVFALVVGAAVGMVWWWVQFRVGEIETYKVEAGDLITGVTVSGSLRCKQKTAIASELVAAITEICVSEGQAVQAGEPLVRLDDRIIVAECAKSAASLELAGQQLAEMRAGARAEEIAKAQEDINRAQASLEYAEQNRHRVQRLAEGGLAGPSERDQAENTYRGAQADLNWAKAQMALLKAGSRDEQIAAAQAEVSLAVAEVERCEALREKYTRKAPHAGVVTAKYVHVGEIVSPGQVLLELHNVDSIEVRADVQETQLEDVETGDLAHILADAYPDHPLEAVVDNILPRVDPESGTVTVLLSLAGEPPVALMDGMAVDIALISSHLKGVIRVPAEAIVTESGRSFVWVRKGLSFDRQEIEPGISDGHWVEVKSGLEPGTVVRLDR